VAGVLAYHVWGMGSMTNMAKKICLKRHSEGWDSRIKFAASLSYVVRLYLKKKKEKRKRKKMFRRLKWPILWTFYHDF
jgi:hypothetical protein